MTRFREEVYASRQHRATVRLQRADHSDSPRALEERGDPDSAERRALRSEYFKKKTKRAAQRASQERLDGF